ncbi:hypothetical protein ACWGE0_07660 [Lentzea sp. NPDC054927]
MLLDAVCHLGELGNEVDSVAIGQHKNRARRRRTVSFIRPAA